MTHPHTHETASTNLNGKIVADQDATVSTDNGAFRYGISLFETMLVQDGAIRLAQYHWDRLFQGISQMQFAVPALLNAAALEKEVLRTVSRNHLDHLCRVRLQVFAPGGSIFGVEDRQMQYIIACYPVQETAVNFNENGLVTGIATGLAKSNDSLANLKTGNALVYAMAARQAHNNKWNDSFVLNTTGNIIESSIGNVFVCKGGKWYTPPLSEGCIAGVMRRHIIATTGIIDESPIDVAQFLAADEVFISNAIKGIKWVRSVGDTNYQGQQTRALCAEIFEPARTQ
jgi:branched-chain amino acid aminotransferase